MIKKILSILSVFAFITLLSVAQVSASPVGIGIAAGYAKGNNTFDVVVKDASGTKLVLYVNDKSPTDATVNSKNWATFHRVVLTGSGKVSFAREVKTTNHRPQQRPINYVRFYTVANDKVSFLAGNPNATSQVMPVPTPNPVVVPPAPVPTPVPAPTPSCTNGSYVNSVGNTVCSPEVSPSAPAGATAHCADGTYSFSQSRRGTCSHHGGVVQWF